MLTDAGDSGDLWSALYDQLPEFISFFIGVLVIGVYWSANHGTFDRLRAVDGRYILLTIFYLALVAFLPFPIRVVGTYDENPVAMILFALNLAAVSAMEAVLFRHAWLNDLLVATPSRAGYRWLMLMSLMPVPLFLLSIPVAYINPFLAPLVWALTMVFRPIGCTPPPGRPRRRLLKRHRRRMATSRATITEW